MGKSKKKIPIVKDNGKSKKRDKAIANRIVRSRLKDPDFVIANGNAYKKEFESYNIADYVAYWTKEDAIRYYNTNEWVKDKYPTLESWLINWEKTMLNK